ncbi:50S ribosomal protein L1 [archaeon]|nr:MAG: 50S ribosomal protein L1 [archaeon]
MNENTLKTVKELREKAPKRKFSQSLDLIVNLKEIDMKKPESKINEEFALPYGRGKEAKVVVFSDTHSDLGCEILSGNDIGDLAKNKRVLKKLASDTDFFLAEAKLMPTIGKALGQVLAPRQKMPKIIIGNAKTLVENLRKSTKIKTKDSPVIQCIVGKDDMNDEQLAENIDAVIKHLQSKLPRGKDNIKETLVKMTMSQPVKVEA